MTEGAMTNGQSTELATVQIGTLDLCRRDAIKQRPLYARPQATGSNKRNPHVISASSTVQQLVMKMVRVYPIKGTLQFSDVTVDESTGSNTLRAVFLTRNTVCSRYVCSRR